ncbi:MAG TPA: hypothetical protein VGH49_17110 [Xanthobacteraceae bacterium]
MPSPTMIEPVSILFVDDGSIPNNSELPFLLYRGAIDLKGSPNPEAVVERTFAANQWGEMWRNGIYPYVHYHSGIHEAMGLARGRAKVQFGGKQGQEIEIFAGDVCVLPAGTGHQSVRSSPDLVVIGAYPPSGKYDLCRGSKAEHGKAIVAIAAVPLPLTDPVFGKSGPLTRIWRR